MKTVLLLTISNVFMTFAWYGHLTTKFEARPLWLVVLGAWSIAFFEYCFQVPANRIGHTNGWSGAELKVTQEVITLIIFVIFSIVYLREPMKWNYWVGFGLVFAAVFVVFHKW